MIAFIRYIEGANPGCLGALAVLAVAMLLVASVVILLV